MAFSENFDFNSFNRSFFVVWFFLQTLETPQVELPKLSWTAFLYFLMCICGGTQGFLTTKYMLRRSDNRTHHSPCSLDTFKDFLFKLGMKLYMHLVQLGMFFLNNAAVRYTKIRSRADKNLAHFKKIRYLRFLFLNLTSERWNPFRISRPDAKWQDFCRTNKIDPIIFLWNSFKIIQ